MQIESKPKSGPDGRHLRSEKSRAVIASAMLEMVRESGTMPTTDAVAERAGVSRRSVFRHYADVSELVVAAYELQRADANRRYPPRDVVAGSPEEHVAAYVERAADVYELTSPVRRAAIHMSRDYASLLDLMRTDDMAQHKLVTGLFGQFVKTSPEVLLPALISVGSWTHWNALRTEQNLSVEQARAVVTALMMAVLAQA